MGLATDVASGLTYLESMGYVHKYNTVTTLHIT